MTICDNCDRLASHVIMLAGRAICDTCDDHTRWCSCGLMLAGSARQIIAMAEVHWRRESCRWALFAEPTHGCIAPSRNGVST